MAAAKKETMLQKAREKAGRRENIDQVTKKTTTVGLDILSDLKQRLLECKHNITLVEAVNDAARRAVRLHKLFPARDLPHIKRLERHLQRRTEKLEELTAGIKSDTTIAKELRIGNEALQEELNKGAEMRAAALRKGRERLEEQRTKAEEIRKKEIERARLRNPVLHKDMELRRKMSDLVARIAVATRGEVCDAETLVLTVVCAHGASVLELESRRVELEKRIAEFTTTQASLQSELEDVVVVASRDTAATGDGRLAQKKNNVQKNKLLKMVNRRIQNVFLLVRDGEKNEYKNGDEVNEHFKCSEDVLSEISERLLSKISQNTHLHTNKGDENGGDKKKDEEEENSERESQETAADNDIDKESIDGGKDKEEDYEEDYEEEEEQEETGKIVALKEISVTPTMTVHKQHPKTRFGRTEIRVKSAREMLRDELDEVERENDTNDIAERESLTIERKKLKSRMAISLPSRISIEEETREITVERADVGVLVNSAVEKEEKEEEEPIWMRGSSPASRPMSTKPSSRNTHFDDDDLLSSGSETDREGTTSSFAGQEQNPENDWYKEMADIMSPQVSDDDDDDDDDKDDNDDNDDNDDIDDEEDNAANNNENLSSLAVMDTVIQEKMDWNKSVKVFHADKKNETEETSPKRESPVSVFAAKLPKRNARKKKKKYY